MKHRLIVLTAAAALLAACDSKEKAAEEAAARQKLEAERLQLEKDRAKLAEERHQDAEKKLAEAQAAKEREQAKAQEEVRRQEASRAKLEGDVKKLEAELAKLNAEKKEDQDEAAKRAAEAKIAERQAEIAMAEAKTAIEQRRAEEARARAEAKRLEADLAAAQAREREAAAKREHDAALKQTTAVFYAPLDPLGDWFETDRYGFVWRPHAAQEHSWRPYADGRWLFTDYGWTWQSNEPFGWAVYHYGRWTRLPEVGWIWVPGSEWAPAWVAWRWHRPRQFVGWAPLPPEAQSAKGFNTKVDAEFDIGPNSYAFLPMADFDAPTYAGKFVPSSQLREIMPLTTNVTFIAPRAGGGMVCGGPDMGLINTELRRLREDFDIKPVVRSGIQLLNAPATSASPDVMNAGAVILFAPKLKPLPPVGKPHKLKQRLEIKTVERGWNPSNPWETDEWRTRLRSEAAAADAAERAAASRPATQAAPPRPAATPTPTPRPVVNNRPPPPPKQGGIAPARIEPSSPLFPKR